MEVKSKRIVEAIASAPDSSSRIEELINKLPEGHDAVELLAQIDKNAMLSPANCLAFFTIVNPVPYADKIVRMTTKQLFIETAPVSESLVKLWKAVENLKTDQRINFLARASLLLEAASLALQDSSGTGRQFAGSSILSSMYSEIDPDSQVLRTQSGAWPGGVWSKMEEVLEELDFTREKDGSWKYSIDLDSRERLVSGANLKAYVKAGNDTLSPLALARLSQNLVTKLSLLQRTITMYPADHPSIGPALSVFIELLGSFRDSEGGMVAITILGGELMVNNVRVKSKTKTVQNFIQHLTERRINSISFQDGLEDQELLNFIELINRKPAQIRDRGGLSEMCRSRGIEHAFVDEFRYALVAKDGKLVAQTLSGTLDSALEDLVFKELIDRLQRGDSIKDIPHEQLGEALSRILEESSSGSGKYRSMLADFVATLDPTILEKGVLVSRELQSSLAWSALRKIIDKNLEDLDSGDQDRILDSIDKLSQLACIGAERGKAHTVMHVIDNIHGLLLSADISSDTLFASLILMGTVSERLIASGRLATAAELVSILSDCRLLQVSTPNHASALRRGLSEAFRRIDTPDAADMILNAFMESDESRYQVAERITGDVVFRNLGMRLVDLFVERKREIRARAYSVLRRFGLPYLSMFHSRIDEIQRGGLSVRISETGRFATQDWYIMRNLVALLGDLGSHSSVPLLEQLCDDSDDRIRKLALLSLMKNSREKAAWLASNMIGDPSPEVVIVAVDVLSKSENPDRGLIPAMLRLMHTLPSARKSLMRYFIKVYDDNHVRNHFRAVFQHTRGIPFEDEDLMHDALAIIIRAGNTDEINALLVFLDKNGGGTLRRATAPDSVLSTVSAAIEMIRASEKNGYRVTT